MHISVEVFTFETRELTIRFFAFLKLVMKFCK